jgi:hypothetical protein
LDASKQTNYPSQISATCFSCIGLFDHANPQYLIKYVQGWLATGVAGVIGWESGREFLGI